MRTYRADLNTAMEDLGTATNFTHERLMDTVNSIQTISSDIDARYLEQHRKISELRPSTGGDLQLIEEYAKNISVQIA